MRWNPEQLEAIETLGQNILVCASAGAGKTAVLVERLAKRCLVDRIPLDQIVAMTFTEAAASEMKQRLAKRFNEELHRENVDKAYILSQQTLLQNAQLSTIHSFCMMLIQKHYDAIGLDPAIPLNILSEGSCIQAKKEAFQKVFAEMVQEDKPAMTTLCLHFSSRPESLKELEEAVFEMIKIASTSFNEDLWYAQAKENYKPLVSQHDLPQAYLEAYWTLAFEEVRELLALTQKAKESLSTEDEKEKIAYQAFALKEKFYEDTLLKIEAKEINAFVSSLRLAIASPLKNAAKGSFTSELKAQLTDLEKEALHSFTSLDMLRSLHNQTSPHAILLVDFAKRVHQQYKENKKQLQGLEFNDMETFAWNILQANNFQVANYYKSFYQEILVDEFQDTNEIQNKIIEAISNGSNAFRVGDVKQSIYRFRHAKPDLMRQLMKDDQTKVIHLSYNYRSNQAIVDFNNHFFNLAMNIEGAKDVYLHQDHVQAGSDFQKKTYNPAQFYGINTPEINLKGGFNYDKKEARAHFIAQSILKMKETTPYKKWSDYVILTKSHKDKAFLKAMFDQFNIPYSIDAKEGFYQSESIQMVLSFLRLLLDQHQEIPLVATLLSPLYQETNDTLAKLKMDHASILNGLIQTHHPLFEDLRKANEILKEEGLSGVMNFIASLRDFYHEHLSLQQKTNFDLFLEKVSAFEKRSSSLVDFIQEIDLNVDEQSDEALVHGSDADVVRAMTIHHSKGLQFNVVFYWSASSQKNQDASENVMVDSELGIALHDRLLPERYQFPSFHRLIHNYKKNLEALEEDVRVLYVALTRPQQHLIIVDEVLTFPEPQPLTLAFLKQRKGPTGLLLRALGNQDHFTIQAVQELDSITKVSTSSQKQMEFQQTYSFEVVNLEEGLSPSELAHSSNERLILGDTQGTSYGTQLHEMVEKLPNRRWTAEDLALLSCSKAQQEALLKLAENSLYQHCLTLDILKEVPFHLVWEGKHIDGIIDFVAIGDQDIILIDFKSDSNVDEMELQKRYAKQIALYKTALKKAYPQHSIKSYLYSFYLGKEVELL